MTDKLTHNERVRLVELRTLADRNVPYYRGTISHFSSMSATNLRLVERGFAERRGVVVAKTGRVRAVGTVHITDAGRAVIA